MIILYKIELHPLLPGDVILTGTPEGVSKVHPGDEIRIEIDTIGTPFNPVK